MEAFLPTPADVPSESRFAWGDHPPQSAEEFMEYIGNLQYGTRDPPLPSLSSVVRFLGNETTSRRVTLVGTI